MDCLYERSTNRGFYVQMSFSLNITILGNKRLFSVICSSRSGDNESIKVFVRVRPLTQDTGLTTDGDQNLCLTVTSHNTIRLHSKPEPRTFTYDHVADMDVSQVCAFRTPPLYGPFTYLCYGRTQIAFWDELTFLSLANRTLSSQGWPKILWNLAWMDTMAPFLPSRCSFNCFKYLLNMFLSCPINVLLILSIIQAHCDTPLTVDKRVLEKPSPCLVRTSLHS